MTTVRGALSTIPWAIAVYGLWAFLGSYWAPDACLDVGQGSFDYRTWQCSPEQQDYIETAMYKVPGFWFAFVSLIIAAVLTVLVRRLEHRQNKNPRAGAATGDFGAGQPSRPAPPRR